MSDIKDFYTGEKKEYKFDFGNATDITNWSIWLVVKRNENDLDADAIIRVSSTAGDNVQDAPLTGIMYITANSTDTDVQPGNYHYAFVRVIEGTNPPDVRVIKTGKLKIKQNLNRAII